MTATRTVRALTIGSAALAAAILALQLLVPPVVGLANNGDYESVMGYVGFQYLTEDHGEKYFNWIQTKFAYGPWGWFRSGLVTSETAIAALARVVSEPFAAGNPFDLRVLGGLHALLLVAGLALLVSATAPLSSAARVIAAALLVFFFTDVGYAAPLNSFYSQAASLVFLMLTLGIAARTIAFGSTRRRATLFFVFAALFVASKPQEAIQAPLLAIFGLRLFGRGPGATVPLPKRPALWAALALCAFGVWYFRQTPHAIAGVARYHKVFMELLPHSPAPEQDLADLGLDPAWVTATGKIAYDPASPFAADPAFREAFLERFSYGRLLLFYVTHPQRLASTLSRGGAHALTLRHPRFGNLEHREGVAPGEKARAFSLWSSLRRSLPGHPLAWLTPFLLGNVLLAAATHRAAAASGRLAREGVVLLAAMASCAFLVCVLSNAHGDLPRHLYVFQALCDLLLVADAAWLAEMLALRGRRA